MQTSENPAGNQLVAVRKNATAFFVVEIVATFDSSGQEELIYDQWARTAIGQKRTDTAFTTLDLRVSCHVREASPSNASFYLQLRSPASMNGRTGVTAAHYVAESGSSFLRAGGRQKNCT